MGHVVWQTYDSGEKTIWSGESCTYQNVDWSTTREFSARVGRIIGREGGREGDSAFLSVCMYGGTAVSYLSCLAWIRFVGGEVSAFSTIDTVPSWRFCGVCWID